MIKTVWTTMISKLIINQDARLILNLKNSPYVIHRWSIMWLGDKLMSGTLHLDANTYKHSTLYTYHPSHLHINIQNNPVFLISWIFAIQRNHKSDQGAINLGTRLRVQTGLTSLPPTTALTNWSELPGTNDTCTSSMIMRSAQILLYLPAVTSQPGCQD